MERGGKRREGGAEGERHGVEKIDICTKPFHGFCKGNLLTFVWQELPFHCRYCGYIIVVCKQS